MAESRMEFEVKCKNADEVLALIKEITDGIGEVKRALKELAQMDIDLEIGQ